LIGTYIDRILTTTWPCHWRTVSSSRNNNAFATEQTSGRQRINIHGAIDLQTGQTRMIEVETIDALSTIKYYRPTHISNCRHLLSGSLCAKTGGTYVELRWVG
jgi:hypothetical protein